MNTDSRIFFNLPTIKKNKENRLLNDEIIKKVKIPYTIKPKYNFVIPANIFQTWHTKNLPELMSNAIKKIQILNPRFTYNLFDDTDCRNFIKENYNKNILSAFDTLKPGAYKADLWRYCVLYKKGGIYLDIKYVPVNGFKFINLLEKEHWVLDADNNGIYNALMVCNKGNNILLQAIRKIVENVNNRYYGSGSLDVTGPGLLSQYFSREEKDNFDMKHFFLNSLNNRFVEYNNYIILRSYNGYITESQNNQKVDHYSHLWNIKDIYN